MESRAACARSRSSAASAAVTRTPTVRARRSFTGLFGSLARSALRLIHSH